MQGPAVDSRRQYGDRRVRRVDFVLQRAELGLERLLREELHGRLFQTVQVQSHVLDGGFGLAQSLREWVGSGSFAARVVSEYLFGQFRRRLVLDEFIWCYTQIS